MDHASLIDKLGVAALDEAIPKVGRFAIYKWRERRRIPSRYWPEIIALAGKQEVKLDASDLMNGQPAAEPQQATG